MYDRRPMAFSNRRPTAYCLRLAAGSLRLTADVLWPMAHNLRPTAQYMANNIQLAGERPTVNPRLPVPGCGLGPWAYSVWSMASRPIAHDPLALAISCVKSDMGYGL